MCGFQFMLLTNMSVAQQIAHYLPEQALLRRHEEPIDRRLNSFRERALRLGFSIDTSSPGAFMKSIQAIDEPIAKSVLQMLSYKAMHNAKYFCAGMLDIAKYQHYALNSPLYTHFTSPIRRYADIIVHRQLEAILQASGKFYLIGVPKTYLLTDLFLIGGEVKFSMDRDSVAKAAQQCNMFVKFNMTY